MEVFRKTENIPKMDSTHPKDAISAPPTGNHHSEAMAKPTTISDAATAPIAVYRMGPKSASVVVDPFVDAARVSIGSGSTAKGDPTRMVSVEVMGIGMEGVNRSLPICKFADYPRLKLLANSPPCDHPDSPKD